MVPIASATRGSNGLALHVDRLHALAGEHGFETAQRLFDAAAQLVAAGIGLQRALEIVEHRKKPLEQHPPPRGDHRLDVALHAFLVVVEVGYGKQKLAVVFVGSSVGRGELLLEGGLGRGRLFDDGLAGLGSQYRLIVKH